MKNSMSKELNELRKIQEGVRDDTLSAARRIELSNLMRQKLQSISRLAGQERSRLQKTFACALDVSME